MSSPSSELHSRRLAAVRAWTNFVEHGDGTQGLVRPEILRSWQRSAPVVGIESVAMYDLTPGEPFHAKGEGNGYVVSLGGLRFYLAGVTECTPEMLAVPEVDIMFVPMNLPNGRMAPEVAAECVARIAPTVVYPYHYRELPIDGFVEALRDEPILVQVRDWYPPA